MSPPLAPLHAAVCRTRQEAEDVFSSELFARRYQLELAIARRNRWWKHFALPGICLVDGQTVDFLVDRKWGGAKNADGLWIPNWRERCVCPACGLNNRQRALAATVIRHVTSLPAAERSVYLMEQVTPMFQVITNFLPGVRCVGSEYLGPKQAPGSMVGHVRHEDAEALSFADATFDVVMSNDVLEHVPHPALALAESRRVLKPGGALFFSVPFYVHRDDSRPRAVLENGALNLLESPEYHGNPVDPGGSLVFTDFGWDLIDTLRAAGFADAYAVVYWSLEHGHLGVRNLLFIAQC